MTKIFPSLWIAVPEILLPNSSVDLEKRAVVACDQYTSEPEYREEVMDIVGDDSSTLNIIYPEVYLEEENKVQRIQRIQSYMKDYLDHVLENKWSCFVLLDRKTAHTESRKWLVVALDLEHYDYSVGSQTLIRATEGTIVDRLPPRIQIRNGAPIETPHIMVLIDDPDKMVIEPLFANRANLQKLYDFDLMMNGGHATGYQIDDEQQIQGVISALEKLAEPKLFQQKYSVRPDKGVLLFAMGDGNHSLATAKAIREEKKKTLTPDQQQNHPARFALVELVNVHDEGLTFEPIHRVLFGVDQSDLFAKMQHYFQKINQNSVVNIYTYPTAEEMNKYLSIDREIWNPLSAEHHFIRFVHSGTFGILELVRPNLNLEVGNLQSFLDDYLKNNPQVKIDYVHGEETTMTLWSREENMGFILPIMDKGDFFKTVVVDGALPRKTFSMGEAPEKRYYLECRKID